MNELDFYARLCAEMEDLPDLSASSRGLLYRAAVSALEDFIVQSSPALSGLGAQNLRNALSRAIERIEKEFAEARENSPTGYPAWVRHPSLQPPAAAESPADAATTADAVAGEAAPVPQPQQHTAAAAEQPATGEEAKTSGTGPIDPQSIPDSERSIAAAIMKRHVPPSVPRLLARNLRLIGLLLLRHIQVSARSDRLAYFWLIMEPVLQIALLVTIYWFAGHRSILGMPILPFAMLGIGAWLMFRTMLLRISTGLGREWNLLFFPGVQRIHILMARGLFYFITYVSVIAVFLYGYKVYVDPYMEVDSLGVVALYFVLFFMMSMGASLILMYIFHHARTLLRSMLIIQRVLMLISGAFFVTEQLPEEAKVFLLWNPLLHGVQLIRSAFFIQYETTDASPEFFAMSAIIIFAFGLMCEVAMRRSEPSPY